MENSAPAEDSCCDLTPMPLITRLTVSLPWAINEWMHADQSINNGCKS